MAERRPDPTGGRGMYTHRQFVDYYGPARGNRLWETASPFTKGMQVRATGRLTGDQGQVVERGMTGRVTNVPGGNVRLEYGAVAEVKINGVTFDAQPDMIEVVRAPARSSEPRQHEERRADPTDPGSRRRYTFRQFQEFYGPKQGEKMWAQAGGGAAPAARAAPAERRPDPTVEGSHKTYTREQFVKFYGPKDGGFLWKKAGEPAAPKKAPKKATEKKQRTEVVESTVSIKKESKETRLGWSRDGLSIVEVEADSVAAKAGLKAGMRIKAIAGKAVTKDDVADALAAAGQEFELTVGQRQPAAPKKRPPPKHPVLIRPHKNPKTILGADLKCAAEGPAVVFEFKEDGSLLAGDQALEVKDGKVAFGAISGDGPTDSQKWAIEMNRLHCGDKVLALAEDGSVEMQEMKEGDKAQKWSFRSNEDKEKREAKADAAVEKRADPTEPSGKKYSFDEFVKFYGRKNATKLWAEAKAVAMKKMPAKRLYGQGNPLLDISANVDQSVFEKYGLQPGNAILAEEKHMPLYSELSGKSDVVYVPGGATLNSIRVANWCAKGAYGWASYCGSVADDEYGKILVQKAEAEGLRMPMYKSTKNGTGTCAVCIKDKERSLVANLAAANDFDAKHLEDEKVWKMIKRADVYYSAGFFVTVSPEALMKVAEHSFSKPGATYCFNLSAPFLIEVFWEKMEALLPLVDILFCNETEARTLAKKKGWETEDVAEIVKKAQAMDKKGKNPRICVFTQGSSQTCVATADGVQEFPVPKVDDIVDTNGAGDSFVGGFLANYCRGKSLAKCVELGHAAAGHIIKHSGCQWEGKPPRA